jgi:hypothetical protein
MFQWVAWRFGRAVRERDVPPDLVATHRHQLPRDFGWRSLDPTCSKGASPSTSLLAWSEIDHRQNALSQETREPAEEIAGG